MRIPIAKEGLGIISVASILLGGIAWLLVSVLWWPLAFFCFAAWVFVIAFFRDPARQAILADSELCAPADGTVTEVSRLETHEIIGGPAVRMGIFLSLFDVHVNRSPCAGRVARVEYKKGVFLDARHPESGARNESNTLVIQPDVLSGPIVVRQVAGLIARRIICHARPGDVLKAGERIGMIRFGSRTELIIPRLEGTEILVNVGDRVRAGLMVMARQPLRTEAGAVESGGMRQGSRSAGAVARV